MAWTDGARRSREAKASVFGPHGPLLPLVAPAPQRDPHTGEILGPLTPVAPGLQLHIGLWALSFVAACVVAALQGGDRHLAWLPLGAAVGAAGLLDLRNGARKLDTTEIAPDGIRVIDDRDARLALGFTEPYLAFYLPASALLVGDGAWSIGIAAAAAIIGLAHAAEYRMVRRAQRRHGGRLVYQRGPGRGGANWHRQPLFVLRDRFDST
ncbi:MAG: hypothetical protein AAGC46_12490 [Solirubrobacteraceae bacterium]|nr:hypothetical protein [Patulibacter sp.]